MKSDDQFPLRIFSESRTGISCDLSSCNIPEAENRSGNISFPLLYMHRLSTSFSILLNRTRKISGVNIDLNDAWQESGGVLNLIVGTVAIFSHSTIANLRSEHVPLFHSPDELFQFVITQCSYPM